MEQSTNMEQTTNLGTAPRITPADIEANIDSTWYFTAAEGAEGAAAAGTPLGQQPPVPADHPLRLLTFCVLVLRNGFTVTGQSACASPENFNAEIGRKIARENAIAEVWPLLGFRLRDELSRRVLTEADAAAGLAGKPRPYRIEDIVHQEFSSRDHWLWVWMHDGRKVGVSCHPLTAEATALEAAVRRANEEVGAA